MSTIEELRETAKACLGPLSGNVRLPYAIGKVARALTDHLEEHGKPCDGTDHYPEYLRLQADRDRYKKERDRARDKSSERYARMRKAEKCLQGLPALVRGTLGFGLDVPFADMVRALVKAYHAALAAKEKAEAELFNARQDLLREGMERDAAQAKLREAVHLLGCARPVRGLLNSDLWERRVAAFLASDEPEPAPHVALTYQDGEFGPGHLAKVREVLHRVRQRPEPIYNQHDFADAVCAALNGGEGGA